MIDKSPERIKKLFNYIAPHYDQNNDIISLLMHRIIKFDVIRRLPELRTHAKILDLCCGTGDITNLLQKKYHDALITGVDFSEEMLKIARKKNKKLKFEEADCSILPYANNSFDLVTICFGLRNTPDYDKVLSEINRVLKPNGIFVHLDFGNASPTADKIFHNIVELVAQLQEDDSYIYLMESKHDFPPVEELIKLFARNGLKLTERKDYLQGIISAQYCQKG